MRFYSPAVSHLYDELVVAAKKLVRMLRLMRHIEYPRALHWELKNEIFNLRWRCRGGQKS